MDKSNKGPVSSKPRGGLGPKLEALLIAHGAQQTRDLSERVARCVEQILEALQATASDGTSLSALDVFRIRAGKFAATRLPPALYREPQKLAALRADIQRLGLDFLGETSEAGSRFLSNAKPDRRT